MPALFRSFNGFAAFFMLVLFFDILLSNMEGMMYYSLITKVILLLSLLAFFSVNSTSMRRLERNFVFLAIISFSLGEVFMMLTNDLNVIVAGFLLLLAAKLFYSCAFVYKVTLDVDRLLPYLVFVTLYSLTIIYFLYEVPEHIPAYIFLVITLIMVKLAYLRYEKAGFTSFMMVLSGAALVLASETILVFDRSFNSSQLNGFMVIFLYGLSQYFMVNGMVLKSEAAKGVRRLRSKEVKG